MFKSKSYSTSYSYSNDGKKEISEYNRNLKDDKKNYSLGLKKNVDLDNNIKKEMFYKSKSDQNEFRRIYGKSNNNSHWEMQNIQNNVPKENYSQNYDKYSKYFDELNQKSLIRENKNQLTNYQNINAEYEPENSLEINNNLSELPDYHLTHPINDVPNILNPIDSSLIKNKRKPIRSDFKISEMDSYFKDDFFNF